MHRLVLCAVLLTLLLGCKRTIPGASCSKDADCKLGALCAEGVCVIQDGKGCTADSDCGFGPNVHCTEGVCYTAPVLTLAAPFDTDYDCSGEVCRGAVVNLAALTDGKVTIAGVTSDPTATIILQIGAAEAVSPTPSTKGDWSYEWDVGSAAGEVVVVATATDLFTHTATATRKVWVDVVAPTCALGIAANTRRVPSDAVLVTCSEPLALTSLRGAVALDPKAGVGDLVLDAQNAAHLPAGTLDGNTTYRLALGAGAVDRAGNPATPIAAVKFRTAPVLPAGEHVLAAHVDFPRMAIDLDGAPLVFAWRTDKEHSVLFTWDGKGDGTAGRGAWIPGALAVPVDGRRGPIRDFRLSQIPTYDNNLALIRAGRVLLSPVASLGDTDPAVATYAESENDLAAFHAKGTQDRSSDMLSGRYSQSFPGFVGAQTATWTDGRWNITDAADAIFSAGVDQSLQIFSWTSTWTPGDPLPAQGTVISQGQAGAVVTRAAKTHVWHASGEDTQAPATRESQVRMPIAGLMSLVHHKDGVVHSPAFVAWATGQQAWVGCRASESLGTGWLFSGSMVPLGTDAGQVDSVELGQGISTVAIAAGAVRSDGKRFSKFGLLSGDVCEAPVLIDFERTGGLIEGGNPAVAFSNDGTLWRAVVGEAGLRVLAPIKL